MSTALWLAHHPQHQIDIVAAVAEKLSAAEGLAVMDPGFVFRLGQLFGPDGQLEKDLRLQIRSRSL